MKTLSGTISPAYTFKSPLFWFFVLLFLIAGYAALGPAEQSLGSHVRVVYLHGAWVWTSLAAFTASAVFSAAGLLTRRLPILAWSRALGLAGLFFWITDLPLSLWAMEANWNGLFLAEPRWRLAFAFAVSGLLLQAGLFLLNRLSWTAVGNLLFVTLLFIVLAGTPNVMHPDSPILHTETWLIKGYFGGLIVLLLAACWQVARFFYQLNPAKL